MMILRSHIRNVFLKFSLKLIPLLIQRMYHKFVWTTCIVLLKKRVIQKYILLGKCHHLPLCAKIVSHTLNFSEFEHILMLSINGCAYIFAILCYGMYNYFYTFQYIYEPKMNIKFKVYAALSTTEAYPHGLFPLLQVELGGDGLFVFERMGSRFP